MNRPDINVTPLIDVLLVLLIVFMIVTPIRPSSFKTRIPQEPSAEGDVDHHPHTLVVAVALDGNISLNDVAGLGRPDSTASLTKYLNEVFSERLANRAVLPDGGDRIPRSVFIKAPRSLDYGSIAKVVDAVKMAGAEPIALQIDDLE